ncbi:MAG TPA: hypothetical protein VGQ35_02630, partial [Dongiaceae bacterium]|nr:hypothetical protein [Dongiaceae bacterium]
IEWAKNHVNGVEHITKGTVAESADIITIDNNFQPGTARVTIGPAKFLPSSLLLHLGDAVHNLNSVMDFLWSGLARSCNAAVTSKITFPRDETRQNLQARLSDAKGNNAAINVAFPQAQSFILDVIQPYKEGNRAIWSLNKIDNINKHRMLILATHLISFDQDIVLVGSDGGTIVQPSGVAIQTQGFPLTIGLTPPVRIDNNPKATIAVVFGEPNHFTGEPVVEALVRLVEATMEVVNQFEKAFL